MTLKIKVNQNVSGRVTVKQSQGLPGKNGTSGNGILSGLTAPANTLGNDGDFYIDYSTYSLYGPKASGQWGNPQPLINNGENILFEAGQDIQAFKVITTNAQGLAVYASSSNPEHYDQVVGLAFNSTSPNQTCIVVPRGTLSNPAWGWIPQKAVFLGLNGNLTQNPEVSGAVFCQKVGYAKDPQTIVVGLGESIYL